MSTVYFTSDLHFGHSMIAEIRGYSSIDDHDAELVESITSTLSKGGQLWILGDLSSGGSRSEARALEILEVLSRGYELHLIAGNHDSCHSMHRDAHKHQRRFLDVFSSVQTFARRKVAGRNVMLSHFPYVGDHTDVDRAEAYRLRDEGMWLLHGHTHQAEPLTEPHSRQLHVGWDTWKRPVSLEEIAAVIVTEEERP
ncbi:calcineurin-like phosphoesterase family protein [Rhodococcus sp. 27YEA15]|uniref:metallophosphoesterase family protein n=1 Tax=Rhodococcus sp. 27YEA15 TaxID=3156259 RepID=UPI003C7B828F